MTPTELFESCVPWTHKQANSFARRYANSLRAAGLERDDVTQIAMISLWAAAHEYDPARAVKFISFASVVIANRLHGLAREIAKPLASHCPEPETGFFYLAADAPDPADEAERQDLRRVVRKAIRRLDKKRQKVIHGRLFREESVDVVARRLGLSRARVSQLQADSFETLRTELASQV